ncbi:MAG: hypothetical protein H8K06_08665 [Nitrospira sp.]|nr:hypothetical protein [Nitrospira sp.]
MASFFDQSESLQGPTSKIWVRIEPDSLGQAVLAQVDTGAAWSILDADIAEALDLFDDQGEIVPISTRAGSFKFRLKNIPVQILAQQGDSLLVNAIVAVERGWRYGNFLGYTGFLERVKFAVDPASNLFYFGPG